MLIELNHKMIKRWLFELKQKLYSSLIQCCVSTHLKKIGPSIIYFITLVTLSGKALNLKNKSRTFEYGSIYFSQLMEIIRYKV
jgi:hypothetical protein